MFNTMTVFQLARNPQLYITPLITENNRKEATIQRNQYSLHSVIISQLTPKKLRNLQIRACGL